MEGKAKSLDREGLRYHFTDTNGLIGILTSKQLWATDSQFLNDALELVYARDVLLEGLDPHVRASPPDDVSPRRRILGAITERLRTPQDLPQAYVTCFCGQGDLLSQWRGYGREQGFAIGFDLESVVREASLDSLSAHKVLYGLDDATTLIESTVGTVGNSMSAHHGVAAHDDLVRRVVPVLARVKHPGFREEQEWRLIYVPWSGVSDLRFRSSQIGPVPYALIPFQPDALKRIVIGPSRHPEVRVAGVKRLLMGAGYNVWHVEIAVTATPLRSV